jgi:hypothetical protein
MKAAVHLLIVLWLGCVYAFSQEAKMIDEFGRITCESYLLRMDQAIQTARENPEAKVYIVIYEGKVIVSTGRRKKPTILYPIVGSVRAKIRSIRKLISTRDVPIDKFVFIDGGFRAEPIVEIWLAPTGEGPPKPTPTVKKLRFRKGKASGFCTGCCGPE